MTFCVSFLRKQESRSALKEIPAFAGMTRVSFLRKQESRSALKEIPAFAGIGRFVCHSCESRNPVKRFLFFWALDSRTQCSAKSMKKYFHKFCLAVLFLALFVILWGAWVRFSHSGDGCGMNWPLCHSEWIPESDSSKTWVEWFHRVSSSIFGIFVLFLVFFSFKYFPKKHKVRFWSLMTLVFTISEAFIGALLVLKGLTGQNTSGLRLVILNAHLLNSLFLTASLVFCLRYSSGAVFIPFKKIGSLAGLYFFIALTGSIASLSNTLFPSSSLKEGWLMDFDENSPWIVHLRLWHPVTAVLVGGAVLFYLLWSLTGQNYLIQLKELCKNKKSIFFKLKELINCNRQFLLIFLLFLGLFTGGVTLLTLSPLMMKMIHLLTAYLIWIFILLYK